MILFSSHGRAAEQLPVGSGNAADRQALRELAQLGFLRPAEDGWAPTCADPSSDRRLLSLLSRFDLQVQIGVTGDGTAWHALAIWEPADADEATGNSGAVFSGTGFQPDDAIRSCLGEFAEFQSWLYRPADSVRRCRREELGAGAIAPWSILGFSDAQREGWHAFNETWRGYESVSEPWTFDGDLDWSAASRLSDGSACWLPSRICYGRYAGHAPHGASAWRSDSNGCAAGQTGARAVTSALLELIERDATGIWWYGQCRRPAVSPSRLDNPPLQAALAGRERLGRRVHLLDLTHDLQIPVVAAILLEDGLVSAIGFGSGLDDTRAACSAYLEMCQMELSVALVKQRAERAADAVSPEDRRLLAWLSKSHVRDLPHLMPDGETTPSPPPASSASSQEIILQRLARAGLDTYIVDLQRPDIGVPAVRAFVPGLCHFKPRFGFRRLIEVPRALGWREASFDAKDLSELPLLI